MTRILTSALLLGLLVLPAWAQPGPADQLQTVLNLLSQRYYQPLNRQRLMRVAMTTEQEDSTLSSPDRDRRAIQAMVKSLDDPYTTYLSPAAFSRYLAIMGNQDFGGLGLLVDQDVRTRKIIVMDAIKGSPAGHAGLRTGDIIWRIDGTLASRYDLDTARSKLRGRPGSHVALVVHRLGKSFKLSLVRREVTIPTVEHRLITWHGSKIGYLHIRLFGSDTASDFHQALEQLKRQGARAFVLDLRDNGGGFLQAAVCVCSEFLPAGDPIVSVAERGHPRQVYRAGPQPSTALPLAVLINGHSASASEITAAALSQNHRAVLVGQRSFGKGSVQMLLRLADNAALKLTIAHYHTPDGQDINGVGIKPDLAVAGVLENIGTDHDGQLQAALARLTGTAAN